MWQSKKEKKNFSQSSNIFCLRQNSQMTLFGMKGAICGNLLLFAKKQRKLVPQLGPQDAPFPSLSCVCRVPSVLLQWQTQRMFASPHTSLALTSSCSKDSRLSECCSGLNSGQQLPWGGGEGGVGNNAKKMSVSSSFLASPELSHSKVQAGDSHTIWFSICFL